MDFEYQAPRRPLQPATQASADCREHSKRGHADDATDMDLDEPAPANGLQALWSRVTATPAAEFTENELADVSMHSASSANGPAQPIEVASQQVTCAKDEKPAHTQPMSERERACSAAEQPRSATAPDSLNAQSQQLALAQTRKRARRGKQAQVTRNAQQYHVHNHTYGAPAACDSDLSRSWWREEVPSVLLGYAQFAFNASLLGLALWLALGFVLTVRHDVSDRMTSYSTEILQEVEQCRQLYLANRCEPETRIPHMESTCQGWEHCMNRNPKIVGRARVAAETLGEVINSFVEVMSWRTMIFLVLLFATLLVCTNSVLSSYRVKLHEQYRNHRLDSMHYPRESERPQARLTND
ncbi:uncharacterized protein L969DRAFT_86730 [Mixia osmundae IAM 14324]|nr:uncharacterized protein L969DRAFT_86730 [Mixia osmundae IAM 14324]KEI40102.1 hypothetical protein L969DRAFT_86730 [Mixia osmundae IAM 14324]